FARRVVAACGRRGRGSRFDKRAVTRERPRRFRAEYRSRREERRSRAVIRWLRVERADLLRADLLLVALFDDELRRLPRTSVEKDRDKRISSIRTKRGRINEVKKEGEPGGWVGCF